MKNVFFLIASLFLLNGCASLSGFHTGKTVGENNGEILLSLNLANAPDFTGDEEIDDAIGNVFFPNIEFGGRYGVTEKLDVGLKLNTSLNLLVDTKYQIVGDQESPFAMAVGAGFGTFGLISVNGALLNFQVPLYTSFHPADNVAIYLSPRYIGQFGLTVAGNSSLLNYLGSNFGVEFGRNDFRFGFDFAYYSLANSNLSDDSDAQLLQFGIGAKFLIQGKD
jgi:hypothetical protein